MASLFMVKVDAHLETVPYEETDRQRHFAAGFPCRDGLKTGPCVRFIDKPWINDENSGLSRQIPSEIR